MFKNCFKCQSVKKMLELDHFSKTYLENVYFTANIFAQTLNHETFRQIGDGGAEGPHSLGCYDALFIFSS